MKLKKNGYNALKAIHIIAAAIWLGNAICITLLLFSINNENIVGNINGIHIIHSTLTIPCALLCLITGILFSVCTNWGFIKHRWIIIKYIINLIPMVFGFLFVNQSIKTLINLSKKLGENALLSPEFLSSKNSALGFNILFLALFIFAFIISVIKPKLQKKKVN